jgi:hypothetical protein
MRCSNCRFAMAVDTRRPNFYPFLCKQHILARMKTDERWEETTPLDLIEPNDCTLFTLFVHALVNLELFSSRERKHECYRNSLLQQAETTMTSSNVLFIGQAKVQVHWSRLSNYYHYHRFHIIHNPLVNLPSPFSLYRHTPAYFGIKSS